jgi:hypothetical protein
MKRSVVVLSAAFFLCVFSALLLAQTETVIDARDKERIQPAHAQSSGWSAGVNRDTTLEAVFTIADPNLKPGSHVDYELAITNTGTKATAIPRTLDWKDVDTDSLDQRYVKGSVNLELRAKDATTFIPPTLILYSTDQKPSTALVLAPGDSIRLLGTTILPATAFSPKGGGTATLLGHFCVSAVSVSVTPTGSRPRGISTSESGMWCANADQKYEVTFAPEQ